MCNCRARRVLYLGLTMFGAAKVMRATKLAVLVVMIAACKPGLNGSTYVRHSDGGIGPTIPNIALSFVKEDGSAAFSTTSDTSGHYSISLSTGRYYVLASHVDYEDYTSAPGFSVVSGNTKRTANYFLREPQVTTVLIVRHAEKQNPNSSAQNEPLSVLGQARANKLRDTIRRAGISAVYSTDTKRTRDTVAPLAATFQLPTRIYSNAVSLAADVLARNRGDVVLVAAHSNTVATLANAFGAQVPTQPIVDFDNLYVVSVGDTTSNVVNLQYAANSTPDLTKNYRRAMTLMLVSTVTSSGAQEPQDLQHAARKAGVTAVYTSNVASSALVAPLAAAIGLTPTSFNGSDMQAFANQLLSSHAQDTVIVAGTHDELRQLLRELGGYPFPVIYGADIDHLIVVTRFVSGALRVVPTRFLN